MQHYYKLLDSNADEGRSHAQAEDSLPVVTITLRKLSLHLHNYKLHTKSSRLNKLLNIGMPLSLSFSFSHWLKSLTNHFMQEAGKVNKYFIPYLLPYHQDTLLQWWDLVAVGRRVCWILCQEGFVLVRMLQSTAIFCLMDKLQLKICWRISLDMFCKVRTSKS